MEKAVVFRTLMNEPYRDHPTEDALERFLFNQSGEEELEVVESHFLACDACITRLEALELDIRARKMALQGQLAEEAARQADLAAKKRSFFGWLTLPQISFAGAALAACAFAVTFLSVPREVNLVAERGNETQTVSEWVPLHLHLQAREIKPGPVTVEVVDLAGEKIWRGAAAVRNEEIEVQAPRLNATGYFAVQVYARSGADETEDLLGEYTLKARAGF
jgi:hypothetical protein